MTDSTIAALFTPYEILVKAIEKENFDAFEQSLLTSRPTTRDEVDNIARLLFTKGFDTQLSRFLDIQDIGSDAKDKLLIDTVIQNKLPFVKIMLNHKANINCGKDSDGLLRLCHMHKLLDNEIFEYLLTQGIDVNQSTKENYNALSQVCFNSSYPCSLDRMRLLVKHGININQQSNSSKVTPLILLCEYSTAENKGEMIKFLLENGADPSIKKNTGETAQDYVKGKFDYIFEDFEKSKKAKEEEKTPEVPIAVGYQAGFVPQKVLAVGDQAGFPTQLDVPAVEKSKKKYYGILSSVKKTVDLDGLLQFGTYNNFFCYGYEMMPIAPDRYIIPFDRRGVLLGFGAGEPELIEM